MLRTSLGETAARNLADVTKTALSFPHDGDFFGEMALLRSEPRSATGGHTL